MREGVLEHVGQLRIEGALVDQLDSLQLPQILLEVSGQIGRAFQEAQGEFAADHRGGLDGSPGPLRQAV